MAYYYGLNQLNSLLINANSGFKEHQDINFERGERYIIRHKYGFPYFVGEFHAYNSINNRKIPTFKILHKSKDDILRVGKFDEFGFMRRNMYTRKQVIFLGWIIYHLSVKVVSTLVLMKKIDLKYISLSRFEIFDISRAGNVIVRVKNKPK